MSLEKVVVGRMSAERLIPAAQGELFVSDHGHPGLIVPASLFQEDSQGVSVNLLESRIHLINTLSYLRRANMLEGLVKAEPHKLEARYAGGAAAVVAASGIQRVEVLQKAEESFKRATGYYALMDVEQGTDFTPQRTRDIKAGHRTMWSDFIKKFNLPSKRQDGWAYREKLRKEVAILSTAPENAISTFNREHGLRPHSESQYDADQEQYVKLSSPERLEAVELDPRAGFMPKSSKSLVRVISWLDYLDNPKTELGIINQMREVLIRAQNPTRKSQKPDRHLGIRYGVRALESIAWEVGDDVIDSSARLHSLRNLKNRLREGFRPTLSVDEALGGLGSSDEKTLSGGVAEAEELGLLALVQYLDLKEYAQYGQVSGLLSSPLKATEDPPRSQRPKFDASPGKRKTVQNQYTRPDITDEFKTHIQAKLRTLTVRDALSFIDGCIEDTRNEQAFYLRRFDDLEELNIPLGKSIQQALGSIKKQLQEINA